MNSNYYLNLTVNKTIIFILWVVFLIAIWLMPSEILLIGTVFYPNYINIYSVIGISVAQGACVIIMIIQLRSYFRNEYPVFILSFLINKEKVEIRIRNQIYFSQLWGNVKKIEIVQEVYSIPGSDKDIYKIWFFTSEDYREIRLFSLKIKGNSVKRIIMLSTVLRKNIIYK